MAKAFIASLAIAFCLLGAAATTCAQAVPESTLPDNDACSALEVKDNVKTIAGILGVCTDLRRVVQGRTAADSKSEEPNSESGALAAQFQVQALQEQGLLDRLEINEAASQLRTEGNLLMFRFQNAFLKDEITDLAAERKAYQHTKLINAFLGTSVGAVGTGLQLSSSTSVQHAGDYVSLAGAAVTVVFNVCTADVMQADAFDPSQQVKDLANGDQEQRQLLEYLKQKGLLDKIAKDAQPISYPKAHNILGFHLSCHARIGSRQKPSESPSNSLPSRSEGLLGVIGEDLTTMNDDLNDLRQAAQ